jgi:hypothetical protein
VVACSYRKSNPDILVMQSAQDWLADNTPHCTLEEQPELDDGQA